MIHFNQRRAMLAATTMLTMLGAMPAWAQQIDPPAADVDDIVVTGYRASAHAAVTAKRRSDVILDSISQDDIGRLPDLNVVESARRIVGLSTVGGLDATKNRDIYQRVTIRGLDPRYNLITVDGAPIASSEFTVRGARLEQLPVSLVARIEAIKTVTAAFDPHALGGQLNIVSRSAFTARDDRFFALNAYAGTNSTAGDFLAEAKPSFRADATGALIFGADDQFGLVVSGEYQNLSSSAFSELPGDTNGNGYTYYTATGTATPFRNLSSTGFIAPVRLQDFRFDNERTRASLNAKLEYRISDTAEVSAFAGYYHDKDEELRAEILTIPGGAPTALTAETGGFATGELQQGIVRQPQERNTTLFTLKGDFDLTSDWTLNLVGSASNATYDEQRTFHKWAGNVIPGRVTTTRIPSFGYTYAFEDGVPRGVHTNPTLGANPDAYQLLYIRDVFRQSNTDVLFGKAELAFNADADDQGFGGRVGANITRTDLSFDVRYSELTSANAVSQAQIGGLGNFIYPRRFTSRDTPQVPYLVVDPDRVLAYVAANPTQFVATDQRANNFGDDFSDLEETTGLYVQGHYRSDRLFLTAGLRRDATDLTVDTFQVPATAGSTVYTPLTRKTDYAFTLPSFLATYNLTQDMRVTGAVTQTIGRPDYSQYAARTTYGIGTDGVLTINTGNPNLQPREAVNYDLSYEWYLPGGGLFSVAGFYKSLKNEIFTAIQAGPATSYLGVNYANVVQRTPLNAAEGEVKGLEIGYSDDGFDFLPEALQGFGVNANLTLLEGSFNLPTSAASIANGGPGVRETSGLIQQPDYIVNLTVFYASGPFEGRLSYNRIGRALQQADQDTPERDLYQEPREQVDLQLRYEVVRGLDAIFQVQNLTKEPFEVRQGVDRQLVNNFFPVGSTVWFGLSWKPDF
ncbi:TonB-dependent receptor [Brevundimonas sp.]|uniref:TonB-dependent receptor n=1 Tax=Brevundimonas sp. TaxID=1871086 RepID=UPI003D148F16